MALDAQTILAAIQGAGLPVTGLSIGDLADGSTWTFSPATLTADQIERARTIIALLLMPNPVPVDPPPTVPDTPTVTGPTLDQAIVWLAGKYQLPVDQVRREIVAEIP